MLQKTNSAFASSVLDSNLHLQNYCLIKDPHHAFLEMEDLFSQKNQITLISKKLRREVYHLKTEFGSFFLKYSPLRRKKDRYRFLLLPWRIKTEWRNLYRLKKRNILVPQPVLFAYQGLLPCQGFFLVTEEINGKEFDCSNNEHIFKLAKCLSFLHGQGVYHKDLHPKNILINKSENLEFIDVQEVFFLPYLPHWLKVKNLGRVCWHIWHQYQDESILFKFLQDYNFNQKNKISYKKIAKRISQLQEIYIQSRSKRCCKESTEFQKVKESKIKGYKKRGFNWSLEECLTAFKYGKYLKPEKIIYYKDVCLKIHKRHFLHKDRCLAAWKMNRKLSIMGVNVPEGLAYFCINQNSYFLSRYYPDSLTLNSYLSSFKNKKQKYSALKQLAEWIQMIHRGNIWQRDFKSSNILINNGQFIMLDLEGVKICKKLSLKKKIVNLAQLNASISNAIDIKDRIRFFHLYWAEALPPKKKRRKIYKQIQRITKGKNTLPFDLDLNKLT